MKSMLLEGKWMKERDSESSASSFFFLIRIIDYHRNERAEKRGRGGESCSFMGEKGKKNESLLRREERRQEKEGFKQ